MNNPREVALLFAVMQARIDAGVAQLQAMHDTAVGLRTHDQAVADSVVAALHDAGWLRPPGTQRALVSISGHTPDGRISVETERWMDVPVAAALGEIPIPDLIAAREFTPPQIAIVPTEEPPAEEPTDG